MKRASKKLISLLLALCMLAGMTPMYAVTTSATTYTASSWSDLKNKVASANSGDIIQFNRTDVLSFDAKSENDTITIKNKKITIKGINGGGKLKRNNGTESIFVPGLTFFIVGSGGTLVLEDITFYDDGGTASAIIIESGGTVETINTGFWNFRSTNKGGAFYVKEGGSLTLKGQNSSWVSECRTITGSETTANDSMGGAIYNEGTVKLLAGSSGNTLIKNCKTNNGKGGAIYNAGTLYVEAQPGNAPAIYGFDGQDTYAAQSGAAIYNTGTVELSGKISNCSATVFAGGIYNDGGVVNIKDGAVIESMYAAASAGALFNANNGTVNVSGGEIKKNSAFGVGGGIYNNGGTLKVTGGTFSGNIAKGTGNEHGGGAVYNGAGNANISGGFFTNNQAQNGAAILVTKGTATVEKTGFQGNAASISGDDLQIFNNGSVSITSPSFNTNQQRTYVAFTDAGTRCGNGTPTTSMVKDGTYTSGGYKFLPRSFRDDTATINAGNTSPMTIKIGENDFVSGATIIGISTTAQYSPESQFVFKDLSGFKYGATKEIQTSYATVNLKSDDTVTYTLRSDVIAAMHTKTDITDVFYYDGLTMINYNGSTFGATNAKVTVTIKANKNHDYMDNAVVTAPTCVSEGYTTHTCAVNGCGYTYKDSYTPATGVHTWTDWQTVTAASCVKGLKERTCKNCSEKETQEIPALPGATHVNSGEYKQLDGAKHEFKCSKCNTWVEASHSFGAETSYTEGTVTVKTKTCVCGYVSRTYSGASVPTMIVGQGTTTANSTVTIPVRLLNNPGIWAQNFIIYYPENLELINVSSSTELYPDTDVVSTKNITAVDNGRVKSAMLAEEKSPAGMKALIYYVDNVALEDVITTQGDIVYLTFKVPNNALSEYNIGIIGADDAAFNCDLEDISNLKYINGKITVTNPGSCSHSSTAKHQSFDATCVADGYSCNKCDSCGNIINSTYNKATGIHRYTEIGRGNASCSQKAYTTKKCTVCDNTVTEYTGDYAAHTQSSEVVIKEATAMTKGIRRWECTVCDYYEDIEFDVTSPNKGTSTGAANSYSYVLTDSIVAGGEYVITNMNDNGSVVSMSANASSTNIVNGAVTVSGNTVVEDTVQDNEIWNATSDGLLVNKATGQYLKAFENSNNAKKTHLNVGLASDPFTNSEQFLFNNGVYNKNDFGYYLGWANHVTESVETALPSNRYLKASSWLAFQSGAASNLSHQKVYLDTNFEFEFDATFGSEGSRLRMFRPIKATDANGAHGSYYTGNNSEDPENYSWNKFCIEITPTTVMIAGADFDNQKAYYPNVTDSTWSEIYGSTTGSYSSGSKFDYTQWNHYKITVDGTYARAYVNGTLVVTAKLPDNFGIAQTETNYDCQYSRGLVLLNYDWWPAQADNSSMDDWNVGIDNMKIVTRNNTWTTNSDGNTESTIGGTEEFTFFWDFEDENGDNEISGIDNYLNNQSATVTDNTKNVDDYTLGDGVVIYAREQFIASGDSSNKVYFYKKTSNEQAAEIYKRVNDIEPGAEYVIVSDNLEGNRKIVKRDGTLAEVTVYSDAISFDPYVTLADGGQYSFVLVGSDSAGYLINSADNGTPAYLKADGTVTSSPISDNIIKIQANRNGNKYFEINNTRYYLYKKTEVTKIDTDLVNDISVVDFGWGFVLDGDSDLRKNDSWNAKWTDKPTADMKLSSLVTGVNGTKNNYFYKTAKGTGSAARLSNSNYNASVANNKITYSPNGKYESEQSFTYEFKITNIDSYIYGDVTVIPATTVYYEETFMTFKDATASGGSPATWTSVGETEPINGLLSMDNGYGNDSAYGSYSTFSAGRAMMTTITADQANGFPEGYNPTAEFTFTGTGFEVFAATSGATGCLAVVLKDESGKKVENFFVDTYYGYTYNEETEKWEATGNADVVGQYQVPVVKKTGLTWGKYTVEIQTMYDEWFDHGRVGYSKFYFDGVRVFDPLGTSPSNTVKEAYKADKEYAPKVISLRDQLASGSNMALYLDGKTLSGDTDAVVSDYKSLGANNEVQLGSMGTVAFNVKTSGTTPAKVSIGIKLASGTTSEVTIKGGNVTKEITVNSATDMYYDITDVYNALGAGTMIVTNSETGAVVSLTTLKYSYDTEPTSTSSLALYSNSRTVKNANRMMRAVYDIKDETFTAGDVNGDGKINAMDVLTLKRYLAGYIQFSETELKAADVNGDGRVNSRDILALKAMM